jgi:hypothetical protein
VFKDVPGLTEVTFTFPPPPLDYVFLLHFENNLTDDCGNTFEADGGLIAEAGLPNSFTYTSDSPAMGAYSGRCPGTNNHIRSETWDDLQLAAFDWQIEGFIRLRNVGGGVGGPIISTGSLQTGGATVGPLPANGQFALTISAGGVFTCDYATAIGNSELTVVGSPAAVAEDVWQHFALVSDATSTRLYSGPVSGGVSTLIAESVGVRPYAGAYDALQRFFIICEYTGGIPPLRMDRAGGCIDHRRAGLLLGRVVPRSARGPHRGQSRASDARRGVGRDLGLSGWYGSLRPLDGGD